MKILLTGGGTGGHFYPIIAVAEAIRDLVREKRLIDPSLYYAAPDPYDRDMLVANGITFVPTAAGKMRNYFSIRNFFDWFKTGWGTLRSVLRIFFLYPDVVFGKGGYASFPTLLAARLFRIPVVIHESDSEPGRVNRWAGKFAERIAVSFHDAEKYFPAERVVYTGNPIRKAALRPSTEGAYEFLKFDRELPILLITGGSQGAQAINEAVLAALPLLLERYQVVHQTGTGNLADVEQRANIIIGNTPHKARYRPFGYLNDLALRLSAGAAALVISRAGSTIFEIAAWGTPSILIPIPPEISHDQTKNAYAYARTGACVVIEQNNLTPNLLISEIDRILSNAELGKSMSAAAQKTANAGAAREVADMLLEIGLRHEA